jgi:hypothetical protein
MMAGYFIFENSQSLKEHYNIKTLLKWFSR